MICPRCTKSTPMFSTRCPHCTSEHGILELWALNLLYPATIFVVFWAAWQLLKLIFE